MIDTNMNKDEFLAEHELMCKEAINRVKNENPNLDRNNIADLIKSRDLLFELMQIEKALIKKRNITFDSEEQAEDLNQCTCLIIFTLMSKFWSS